LKLTNVLLLTLLGAGLLQATIIQTGSPLTYSSGLVTESLGAATGGTLTTQQSVGGLSFTQSGLSFSSSTGTTLYYDPNGAGQCSNLNGYTLTSMTNCVGDYSYNSSLAAASQSINGTAPYDITLSFAQPVYSASILFAIAGAGPAGTGVFTVTVKNGSSVVDTQTSGLHGNFLSPSSEYLDISELGAFTSISIDEIANVYAINGSNNTFTAIIGNITESTVGTVPEPGTIGLLGFGLASLGYFARRRKA
jgi:hypothetical protein